jgi:hypothetical protein
MESPMSQKRCRIFPLPPAAALLVAAGWLLGQPVAQAAAPRLAYIADNQGELSLRVVDPRTQASQTGQRWSR